MKRLIAIIALMLPFLGAAAQDLDAEYAVDLLRPGVQAPDFTLNDISGKPVTLSSFRGRQVVLVFWASWCPDCRAEVPQLKALQAQADPEKVARRKEGVKGGRFFWREVDPFPLPSGQGRQGASWNGDDR